MSIRIISLYFLIFGLSIYAWKNWFKSLCGLILLMAIVEHGDMPKSMFGIQGMNPWNILFGMIFLAWLLNRRREGLAWDMPRNMNILLLLCLGVILIGVFRAIFDRGYLEGYSTRNLISEELINTIKWVIPGLLVFDACRTRKRVVAVLVCLLVMYFLIAVQVIRVMPPQAALGSDSSIITHARMKLNEGVGYQATDLSVLLGGACWGLLAAIPLINKKKYKYAAIIGVCMIAFGQALTGGRAGYLAWGMTGLILCLLKWRKYIVLAPVVVILLTVIFPGATGRMLQGFGQTDVEGNAAIDEVAVLSGRTLIWPPVIDKISESPVIGYGRRAMERTGITQFLFEKYGRGEAVKHPHNMYFETLLDNGIIGSLSIFVLWFVNLFYSTKLFIMSNRLCSAVGGLSLALMLTNLMGGFTGQHYFPLEHTFGIWVASFLSWRVYFESNYNKIRLDI